jgi:hypothetical protein
MGIPTPTLKPPAMKSPTLLRAAGTLGRER